MELYLLYITTHWIMYFKTPIIKRLSKHSSFAYNTKSICIQFCLITYTTKFNVLLTEYNLRVYVRLMNIFHIQPNWVIMMWVFVTPVLEHQIFFGAN